MIHKVYLNTTLLAVQNNEPEIQQDPVIKQPIPETIYVRNPDQIKPSSPLWQYLSEEEKAANLKHMAEFRDGRLANSNDTTAPDYIHHVYTLPNLTYEALMLNTSFRTAVGNLDHIAEAFNVVLKKDNELVLCNLLCTNLIRLLNLYMILNGKRL